ncbi:hypothetical protein [Cohnella sp. AR92]|uniref:hypothetical protein n=1 Tax=Cohnella sp. AR92 TaxID=648716 RepID=UPI000F8D9259|nr:hypothetical protein [Cohnella sp. AR92]RUS47447.1 hypothetical protein ELR57_10035 [Cohnella sp. AR92]
MSVRRHGRLIIAALFLAGCEARNEAVSVLSSASPEPTETTIAVMPLPTPTTAPSTPEPSAAPFPASAIPYALEDVKSISLNRLSDGEPIAHEGKLEEQLLYDLERIRTSQNEESEWTPAPPSEDDEALSILIKAPQGDFSYQYRSDDNLLIIGGKSNHAGFGVLQAALPILSPDSAFANWFHLKNIVLQDELAAGVLTIDEGFRVDFDLLLIDGLDYDGWEKKLSKLTPHLSIPYYDNVTNGVSYATAYQEGILHADLQIAFSSPDYATGGDIRVGMAKKQVQNAIGKPNLQVNSQWSYLIGDYLKFYLLFEDDKVKYMVYRMPV